MKKIDSILKKNEFLDFGYGFWVSYPNLWGFGCGYETQIKQILIIFYKNLFRQSLKHFGQSIYRKSG